MKTARCCHCGAKLNGSHKFDKDGMPICDGCWETEDEQLRKEMGEWSESPDTK